MTSRFLLLMLVAFVGLGASATTHAAASRPVQLALGIDTDVLAFGAVPLAQSRTQTRLVTNDTQATVSINPVVEADTGPSCGPIPSARCDEEIALTRASFAVTASTCQSVAPGDSCTVSIRFEPKATFAMAAELRLTTQQDPDGAEHVVELTGIGAPSQTVAGTVLAVEYYHADLDHYFVTAYSGEQALLDTGELSGWEPTGVSFWVYPPGSTESFHGLSPSLVCRFYGLPEAGLDSHFYSGSPTECELVAVRFPDAWQLESNDVFRVLMPDPTAGACLGGTTPVYRVFNNRADANHRYLVDRALRDRMVDRGWIKEGYGPDAVAMCALQTVVPLSASSAE